MTREQFYSTYKSRSDEAVQLLAKEYDKLTPAAQEALSDVLRERSMTEFLPKENPAQEKKSDLSKLSSEELRVIINRRLDSGEKIDEIKADLRSRGVDIYKLFTQEGQKQEQIDERYAALRNAGKSEEEINASLKKEFGLTEEGAKTVPDKIQSAGTGLIFAGALILLISLPLAAVILQSDGYYSKKLLLGIPVGAGLLVAGIRKRNRI